MKKLREKLKINEATTKEIAQAIKAPDYATTHEGGGKHGGGTVGFSIRHDHKEAHKNLTSAGFVRDSNKRHTETTKLGRSAAHTSSKVQNSEYSHPDGHTASIKTETPRHSNEGGPRTFYNVHTKKPAINENHKPGTKVWFHDNGKKHPAIVTGSGKKHGDHVYDVELENEKDSISRNRWGYADQIKKRD